MKNIFVIAILVILGWVGFSKYMAQRDEVTPALPFPPGTTAPLADTNASAFTCDGRTHCSQMTSCAEANYFIQHCPNTKMDGNNDGEPCEQQWCN